MENLFLILIAIVAVLFIWLIWSRQSLVHHLRSFQRRDELLRRDFQKRRDMVPYLLETFRARHDITPQWLDLLERRKVFHQPGRRSMKAEAEFEQVLNAFIVAYDIRDINYLEAEKNITALNEIIERAKQEWKAEHDAFLNLKKRFPYSVASAIFGVRI